jgi:methyl-accepting chemotaxis protein
VLANLKVSQRLLLGFGLIIMMLIIVTIIAIDKVNTINNKMTIINDLNSVKQRHAINFRGSVHDRAIAIRDVVLVEDLNEVNVSVEEIRRLETFYSDSAGPMDSMMERQSDVNEREMLKQIKQIEKRTLPLVEEIIKLRRNGDDLLAKSILMEQGKQAFIDWLAAINALIDYEESQNNKETIIVRETAGTFSGIMVGTTAFAALIALLILWWLVSQFKKQLGGEPHEIATILEKMASGNLNLQIRNSREKSVLSSVSQLQ